MSSPRVGARIQEHLDLVRFAQLDDAIEEQVVQVLCCERLYIVVQPSHLLVEVGVPLLSSRLRGSESAQKQLSGVFLFKFQTPNSVLRIPYYSILRANVRSAMSDSPCVEPSVRRPHSRALLDYY